MKNKFYKHFSLVVAIDQDWDVGYETPDDNQFSVKYVELHSPTLKCIIVPMPRICRSSCRANEVEAENLFLAPEPIRPVSIEVKK